MPVHLSGAGRLCRAAALLACAPLLASVAAAQKKVQIPTVDLGRGVHMPVLSIGTAGLEGIAVKGIVATWLELGGTGIDTAWEYKNQDLVRDAIKQVGVPREKLFITTKIPGCYDPVDYVEDDLRILGIQYIDLLLIAQPRPALQCPEVWETLEEYYHTGLIKAIGVSNFQAGDLEKLLRKAKVLPVVNQVPYNVLDHEDATVVYSNSHGIHVESISPVGKRGQHGNITGNADVKAIAGKHQASPHQVAMKWVLQHGSLLTFESSTQSHMAIDADLFGFNLTSEEMALLDKVKETQQPPPMQEVVIV